MGSLWLCGSIFSTRSTNAVDPILKRETKRTFSRNVENKKSASSIGKVGWRKIQSFFKETSLSRVVQANHVPLFGQYARCLKNQRNSHFSTIFKSKIRKVFHFTAILLDTSLFYGNDWFTVRLIVITIFSVRDSSCIYFDLYLPLS